jgi:uncharacterized SAM-binding protein YcdF (DUF218 family)
VIRLVKLLALAVFVVAVYVAFTFLQVWWASRHDEARPAQAIVVLGAAQFNGVPSSILKARLDHAFDLVSDAFHSYRIDAIAQELGLEAHPSPTHTSPITGFNVTRHLVRETAAVAVGRIVGYRREAGIHHAVESELQPE